MNYFEEELIFTTDNNNESLSRNFPSAPIGEAEEILGIKVRLGNQPLVYSFKDLLIKSGRSFPSQRSSSGRDHYFVVHAISAIRTCGKATVDELQYFAISSSPAELQTIDLIPKTRFKEILRGDFTINAALDLSGRIGADIPTTLTDSMIPEFVNIGSDFQLQLCTSIDFVGQFKFSIQLPIVQAAGIGSNSCAWILNLNEQKRPLLGDQLLVQSISVPANTRSISYKLKGSVKADKGIFWKQREKTTPEYNVTVDLH
jgi:hypothetical protein